MQTSPCRHAGAAQVLPQWLGSVVRLVHTPLHTILPPGQVHWPATQLSPAGQAMLQPPQWLGSFVSLTQPIAPWQSVSPVGQPHTPAVQVAPGPHSEFGPAQLPQWAGSVAVLTQPGPVPQ